MKTKYIGFILFITCMIACRKEAGNNLAPVTVTAKQTLSLDAVKQWIGTADTASSLQTAITTKAFRFSQLKVDWNKAQSMMAKGKNYWLIHLEGRPVFQGVTQGYRKMAVMRDSTGKLVGRILEIIPDGLYYQRNRRAATKDFSGRLFIYDQNYHLLKGFVYAGGKIIGKIQPKAAITNSTSATGGTAAIPDPKMRTLEVQVSEDCEWYDSNYVDSEGVFTVYSENICTYAIYDDGMGGDGGGGDAIGSGDYLGGGGGGGGDAADAPAMSDLPGELAPAVDPKALMKCFGNIPDAGATMSVTVYVQEPWPGTSFNIGPNSVGHTAIGLTKSGGGASITQTVGFYPTSHMSFSSASKISDNSGLSYNVSITYNVTAAQFAQISNYVASPPATYDLANFNCTNFVEGALGAGSITAPDGSSITGLNGATMSFEYSQTPAGMGSTIQNMQGKPGVNTNGGTVGVSSGPCN